MKILLLLIAWFMLRFVHHRYTVSHPKGIFYKDISDYITAFMYQPLINLVLVIFILIALGFIYTIIYLSFQKLFEYNAGNRLMNIIQLVLALYLLVIGFMYFAEISTLFFVVALYFLIQSIVNGRKRRIKRIRHF